MRLTAVLSEPTTSYPPKVTTPTPSPPMYVVNVHYLALNREFYPHPPKKKIVVDMRFKHIFSRS
jgi:hypothetical protein